MYGLASKSRTTWFLAGVDSASASHKMHFETPNVVQLTYAAAGNGLAGLTWFINTAYHTHGTYWSLELRMFTDTATTIIEQPTLVNNIFYLQQVSVLPVLAISSQSFMLAELSGGSYVICSIGCSTCTANNNPIACTACSSGY
jgi:hypothetical protein